MQIERSSNQELVIADNPWFMKTALIWFSVLCLFFVVEGVLVGSALEVMGGFFASGAFIYIGGFALTTTTANFSRETATIKLDRKSLIKRRSETYPLKYLIAAKLHVIKNRKGKSLFAIKLIFDDGLLSDEIYLSRGQSQYSGDVRGIGGLQANEFPLANYADSTGRTQKEEIVRKINDWIAVK